MSSLDSAPQPSETLADVLQRADNASRLKVETAIRETKDFVFSRYKSGTWEKRKVYYVDIGKGKEFFAHEVDTIAKALESFGLRVSYTSANKDIYVQVNPNYLSDPGARLP